jgi:hypothetical protein
VLAIFRIFIFLKAIFLFGLQLLICFVQLCLIPEAVVGGIELERLV